MPPPPLNSILYKKKESTESRKKYDSESSQSEDEDSPKRFTSKKIPVSDEDLEQLFSQWSKLKKTATELEEKEKQIKKAISNLMDDDETDSLFSDTYTVKRRIQKRRTLSQKDVPEDIWQKYSKEVKFPVYTLKKI